MFNELTVLEFNTWLGNKYSEDRYLFKKQFNKLKEFCKKENISMKDFYNKHRKELNPKPSLYRHLEKQGIM